MAGQMLPAHELRALAPRTLLFSGTKAIVDTSTTPDTQVDTLGNVIDNDEIPWTLADGVLTLDEGGFFLVSLVGVFTDNVSGVIRRVYLRGSSFGSARMAPVVRPSFVVQAPTGGHVCGVSPIVIAVGEELDVFGRQDAGVTLDLTVWLGLTQLPTT